MSRIADRARGAFGLESTKERETWDARQELLRDTVGIDFFDPHFQRRLQDEMDDLKGANASEAGLFSFELRICAEERMRVRALCLARCALPADGVDVDQLQTLGFEIPRPNRERRFNGILRVVGYPDGWQMEPAHVEATTDRSAFAFINDETGAHRMDIFYRDTIAGNSLSGYAYLRSPHHIS